MDELPVLVPEQPAMERFYDMVERAAVYIVADRVRSQQVPGVKTQNEFAKKAWPLSPAAVSTWQYIRRGRGAKRPNPAPLSLSDMYRIAENSGLDPTDLIFFAERAVRRGEFKEEMDTKHWKESRGRKPKAD